MRFWDSSAIAPLLVDERSSGFFKRLLAEDPRIIAWFYTPTELRGLIHRKLRDGSISRDEGIEAFSRLVRQEGAWLIVDAHGDVRDLAHELLDKHALTSGDALQLAAAVTAAQGYPRSHHFVVIDKGLAKAAEAEGFTVHLPPTRGGRQRNPRGTRSR